MLRSIRFSVEHSSVERELDLRDRRIMFEIFDGQRWSAPAFATVTIFPINDNRPHITLTPSGEVCMNIFRVCCAFEAGFVVCVQVFVEESLDSVQLLQDLNIVDMDQHENITQAKVCTPQPKLCGCLLRFTQQ